jgi:hypothetical protein
MSLTEFDNGERCASCDMPGARQLVPELENVVLCDGCADRLQGGETISYWDIAERPPSPPEPSERYERLFDAARVLIKERIADEDLIYPTLAYANELGQRIPVLEREAAMLINSAANASNWERARETFSRRHSGLVPEGVVDRVVILRWLPVDGGMRFYQLPQAKIPEQVTLRIRFHIGKLEPGLISGVYERILSAHEVSYSESTLISSTDHWVAGAELFVSTYASTGTATRIPSEHAALVFGARDPEFPHPDLMERICRAFLDLRHLPDGKVAGYAHLLTRGKRGPRPTPAPERPAKLARACVAYFLHQHGGLPEGMEAHRLLNDHVGQGHNGLSALPETGDSSYESTKLWRSAKNAGLMLEAATRAIYDQEFRA